MSVDLGDRLEDSLIHFMWSTNAADGSSITRAVDGVVSVYKNDDLTQSVAGITDTENFDSLTGVHMCKIDTSADAFYATAEDYTVVLSGATIDGKSVNAVLAVFSIENRYTRGTDSAALAVTWTDAKAVHLDANVSSRNATTPPTVGEIRAEMEKAGTKLLAIETDTNDLQTNQGNWVTATSVTVSDKTGFALSAAGVDAILDENVEGTHSMREMMRLFASMLVGKVSGGGTTTITFRDIDDSKNRIVMTVTDVGNRTGVVLTES